MIFYGIQKTTLVDFPGNVAATLFTGGCNMRCPYCHNPELINNLSNLEHISWDQIYSFLQKRKNVLDGVCITGGEPLIHKDIGTIISKIHDLGLLVKIDTNGTEPELLKKLPVDFIAMDIKTSLENYGRIGYTGSADVAELVKKSIDYIIGSGIDHEFRTTLVPGIVDKDDIKKIVKLIKGAQKYSLAQFRPDNTLDPSYGNVQPYTIYELKEIEDILIENRVVYEMRTNY